MNEDHDFNGQLKYETIQFFFRKHWISFIEPISYFIPIGFFIAVLLLGLGSVVITLDIHILKVLYFFFSIMIIIGFLNISLLRFINYYFNLVIVTDCRIIIVDKTIFMRNDYSAIDLTKIQDISVEAHGIIRNYLKYGKLIITLSTSSPPINISSTPHPHTYLEKMNKIKREHILKRQERKMSEEKKISPIEYLQDMHNINNS